MPKQPLPASACPLCGGPNGCAPARAGSFEVECWCTNVTVSAEALARVPPAQQGKACLCRACARGEGTQADPPA